MGDGKEVHVDAEVREWLSEEGAVVLLKMEGNSVKWVPVLEKV